MGRTASSVLKARNAGKVAFLYIPAQPSADIVRRRRGMQVKLRFLCL